MSGNLYINEQWKPLKEYEGIYEISNYGRVCSIKYRKKKILKQGNVQRYCVVYLTKNKKIRGYYVHRLVLETFKPRECNHKDCNKKNNHVDNLEWVSPLENTKHAKRNNLRVVLKGETSGMSKLLEKEVKDIRDLFSNNVKTTTELSIIYNVDRTTIWNVIKRKTWKHI